MIASLTSNAQYYQLRYDSVRVVSKFKLGNVTTGAATDSLLTKKANGGVYKIAQSSFANDANVIKTTGNQSGLTGNKTYSSGFYQWGAFGNDVTYITAGEIQIQRTASLYTSTLNNLGLNLLNTSAQYKLKAGSATVGTFDIDLPSGTGTIALTSDIPIYINSLRATNATGTPFTKATLNSTYPSVPIGYKVVCTGLGIVYEKYNSTDWFSTTATILNTP